MKRWLFLVVAVAAGASLSGCNNPTCGMGTKQVQNKDGSIQCVPVDALPSSIPCDTDGGAAISGGVCRSAITCGQGTTLVNGVCVGTGTGSNQPPPCPPPASGKVCINGVLHNLLDNSQFMGTIHLAYYSDPLAFLNGQAPDQAIDSNTGTYIFTNVPAPAALPVVAIAVGDPDLSGTNFMTTGSGGSNVLAGKSYRIDTYVLQRSTVDKWTMQTGFDWFTNGGYIARYYNDPKPPDTLPAATETHPIAGVSMTQQNMTGTFVTLMPPQAMYFTTDMATLSPSATSTGVAGAAMTPAPPGGIATYSGMGGGITWETEQGGSAKKVIFVSRFHPM
jgi:hypothetical protein